MAKVARRQLAKEEGEVLELFSNFPKQFWDDAADRASRLIKQLIEECLEEKRTEVLGAQSYERTTARRGRRGGSYQRKVRTRWGEVTLRVPRVAEGSYDLEIIDRYGRRQVEVDHAIGQLWLAGISTRRLNNITEEIFGYGIRRSTISRITKGLDAEVEVFRNMKIPDTVRYLLLDGIHAKVREVAAQGKVFLVAYGIHTDGRREILGFVLADSESASEWRGFLADLKARGLKGRRLRLITVDGNPGLRKALRDIYPLKRVQRCLMHKIRINRPSGLDQPAAAGSPPSFFSRPRCPWRLSMTRPWRTTSLSQPRPAASSRSARTSASWSSMTGTNSAAGTKLSQVSQMLAYGQASAARWREQYPWATRVLSISEESHCTRSGTTGFPAGISGRGWRNRILSIAVS